MASGEEQGSPPRKESKGRTGPLSPGLNFLNRVSLTLGYEKRHIKRESIDLDRYPGGGDPGKQLQLSETGNEVIEVSSNDIETLYSEDRIDSITIQRLEGKVRTT